MRAFIRLHCVVPATSHPLSQNPNFLHVLQVWTFKNRVAFVLSVTDRGEPVRDNIKLQRLQQLLCGMMDQQGNGVVNIKAVRSVPQTGFPQIVVRIHTHTHTHPHTHTHTPLPAASVALRPLDGMH